MPVNNVIPKTTDLIDRLIMYTRSSAEVFRRTNTHPKNNTVVETKVTHTLHPG